MKPGEHDAEQTTRVRTERPATSDEPVATSPTITKVAPANITEAAYVLRFLSGPRAGAEVPLTTGTEVVFGRGKEADVVLGEDLVSRRHAILSLQGGPSLSDLGSTNGTFVNGERINGRAKLQSGDRLLIGTSIARLVELEDDEQTAVQAIPDAPKRPPGSTMAGRLEEVPLVDLVQLFTNSRKSGTLVARGADGLEGEVTLVQGQLVAARVEGKKELTHRKALARLLRLSSGAFEFTPASATSDSTDAPAELQEPTELLLMDSMRLIDELSVVEPELPPSHASVALAKPLPGKLRTLEPADLDLLQLVIEHETFGAVIDHSPLSDVDAARALMRLIGLGYVTVAT